MDTINFIIYLTIFISGTVFGSFFTLAVHRIPKHEDITHERSYCPKCNHKLGFWDLIPVWSYIFLGGKCRYCKNKIRPRYLILEICSGVIFLLLALSMNISFESAPIVFIKFAINVLFIVAMFIIAGIDRENRTIPNSLIIYGLIVAILKIGVAYYEKDNILIYLAGFLIISIFLIIARLIYTKVIKKEEFSIGEGDIKYIAILGLYFGFGAQILGIFISLMATLIGSFIEFLIKKESLKTIPFGFYLSIGFTIVMVLEKYLVDFIESCNAIISL